MYLTRYQTKGSDLNEISFPLLESWNPLTNTATIAAEVNNKRVLCRISLSVLKKKFRASTEEPMQAVAANRVMLQAAARRLIEAKGYEEDGSIMIRQKDIRPPV